MGLDPVGTMGVVSNQLTHWPAVTDTTLDVAGRPLRILRAESTHPSGGVPQLLVHGLGGSSAGWVGVMEGLAEHGPTVAVDLPGFGRSPVGDDPLTVEGYLELLLEVVEALGWERFTLHGNSMGGLIGTMIAADHPGRIERLVLVSPAFPPRSPLELLVPTRATIDGMLPVALSSLSAVALGVLGIAGPDLDERRNRAMLKLIFPDPDALDPAVLELMAQDFADDDGVDRRRALLSVTRSITALWTDPRSTWRAIHDVQAPTLLLGGTSDALVPARVLHAVLAERPDWEGHVLDDRRHALMLEDPEGYLDLVNRWQSSGRAA